MNPEQTAERIEELEEIIAGLEEDMPFNLCPACFRATEKSGAEELQQQIKEILDLLNPGEPQRTHGIMHYTDEQNTKAALYHAACAIAGVTP